MGARALVVVQICLGEVPQVACSLYTFNRTDQLPSFAWGKCQRLPVRYTGTLSIEVASCLDLPASQASCYSLTEHKESPKYAKIDEILAFFIFRLSFRKSETRK